MTTEAIPAIPNERAQFLLKALIQRFIRDGQPVGSRTLSRDSGLDLSPNGTGPHTFHGVPLRRSDGRLGKALGFVHK